jgi:hypothetical protein
VSEGLGCFNIVVTVAGQTKSLLANKTYNCSDYKVSICCTNPRFHFWCKMTIKCTHHKHSSFFQQHFSSFFRTACNRSLISYLVIHPLDWYLTVSSIGQFLGQSLLWENCGHSCPMTLTHIAVFLFCYFTVKCECQH